MHPVLLIGGAVMALMAGGKKKSSGKSGGSSPGTGSGSGGRLTMGQAGGGGSLSKEVWGSCNPPSGSPKGTYAAYGKDLKCMVFWGPETWEVARAFIEADLSKLSQAQRDEICDSGECVPDPYAVDPDLFCEWTDNPAMVAAVKRVCIAMYPQLEAATLPPPPQKVSPFFPAMVWKFVWYDLAKYHCGFEPVT